MASHSSQTTTGHDTIRAWAEARGGVPATVADTENGDEPGVLRTHFPGGGSDEPFDERSWEEFFDAFEDNDLAFLYQDETKDGGQSRFHKFVARD